VLAKQPSHDHVSIFLRVGVLAFAKIQLVGHPLREWAFVRLDGRNLFGVPCHIVGQRLGQLLRERLSALDTLGGEAKSCSLKTGIAR
jgi:hypothetical protein